MLTIVYQADFRIMYEFTFFPIAFFVLGILVFRLRKNKYIYNKRMVLLFGLLMIFAGVISVLFFVVRTISNYENIILPYEQEESIEIEGYVENLTLHTSIGSGVDEFEINGTVFMVGNELYLGLQKTATNGGPINQEGMHIRVEYVTIDNMNFIVELEIID